MVDVRLPLLQRHARLAPLGLAVLLVTIAAACGTGGGSATTAEATSEVASTASGSTAPVDTAPSSAPVDTAAAQTTSGSTAPASTSAAQEPGSAANASCADALGPDSVEALACAWIADTDPAVCARMSDRLLGELFGAGGSAGTAQCRSALRGVPNAEDPSQVTLDAPERNGKRATIVVADRSQDIVYALELTREGGGWAIDKVQQLANAAAEDPDETPETVTPNSPGDDGEIAALVTGWYAEVDPRVCDSMTNAMLDFGWGAKRARGRGLCEQSLREADPVGDVVVRAPTVSGDEAAVEVVYTLAGDRQVDEIGLVRRNGAWLIDSVRLAGLAS